MAINKKYNFFHGSEYTKYVYMQKFKNLKQKNKIENIRIILNNPRGVMCTAASLHPILPYILISYRSSRDFKTKLRTYLAFSCS